MKPTIPFRRALTVLSLLLLLLFGSPAQQAQSESLGPNNPRSVINDVTIGAVPWIDPGNLIVPGTPYTTIAFSHEPGQTSNYLEATDYGFTIPDAADVVGITVEINRFVKTTPSLISDHALYLLKGGSPVGLNYAHTGVTWPELFAVATYGGSDDRWGESWTPAEVNNSGFGVALAVIKPSRGNRTATVDTIQITVTFINHSTTELDCGGGTLVAAYGSRVLCTATVTRGSGYITPGGTVNFSTDSTGSFEPSQCELSGAGGTASCSVYYTPQAVGDGSHQVTAAYLGDASFYDSSDTQELTVVRRVLSITANPQTKVFGQPDPPLDYQVTTGSLAPGDAFTGALVREPGEDAGQYAILQGDLTVPGADENYDLSFTGALFTIQQVVPVLTITNSPVTFNGLPQAAQVEASVPGVVSNVTYNGSGEAPVSAGTYTVLADFLPDDAVNYQALSSAEAGEFVILPTAPQLALQIAPSPTVFTQAGDQIDYTYTLTNSGDVPLSGPFTVTDDHVTVTCPTDTELLAGASLACTGSYIITLTDAAAGSVTNRATGAGYYLGEPLTSPEAQATVALSTSRSLQYQPLVMQ